MIEIEIMPARGRESGYMSCRGHAGTAPYGQDLVCCAVTTLFDALEANLRSCWDVRVGSRHKPGDLMLTWGKTNRNGSGLNRANQAAGFCSRALKALAEAYPNAVCVIWKRREPYEYNY